MSDKNIEILKVRERGQLTLPKRIRVLLNLKTGDELVVKVVDKELILKPRIENPLRYAGMLGGEEGVERVKDLTARYKGFK